MSTDPRFGDDVPVAYLRQCVVNACRSAQRHRGVQRRKLVPLRMERDEPERPDLVAERDDERSRMMQAPRSLPQRQQEVLALRYYSELSEAEIAEALGITRGGRQVPRQPRRSPAPPDPTEGSPPNT